MIMRETKGGSSVQSSHRKGVVYSIPCAEYPQTYIGQTGISLDNRLCEHCRALKNGDVTALAIAEHAFSPNHQVDLSKTTVTGANPHLQTRCMVESTRPPSTKGRAPCLN